MSYRLSYYEDDVVEYSSKGRHPKLPPKHEYCIFYVNHQKHKLKSFWTEKGALVAFSKGSKGLSRIEDYIIFKCPRCQMYHIIHRNNYDKMIREQEDRYLHTVTKEQVQQLKPISDVQDSSFIEGVKVGKKLGFTEALNKFEEWLSNSWRKFVWLDGNKIIHFGHWRNSLNADITYDK